MGEGERGGGVEGEDLSFKGGEIIYPFARRDETVVENYHGTLISDPYRWLEDPDSEETQLFVTEQNKVTASVLSACGTRDKFKARMTELYDYPRYGCPFKYENTIFYFYNTGLQAQSVLYMQRSLDSEAEVLLDPNTLSDDGTVSLSTLAFTENGQFFAYGLSTSGSDWQTVKVMEITWLTENASFKRELKDELKWVKHTSLAWTHDNKGFFYNRFPEPSKTGEGEAGTETDISLNQKLYYHFLGTDQSEDILCWEDPKNPKWMSGAHISDDGKYLLLSISEGCDPVNRLFYCDLETFEGGLEGFKNKQQNKQKNGEKGEGEGEGEGEEGLPLLPWIKLVDNFEAQYSYVTNEGPVFTFHTNKNAPKYKVERVNLEFPGKWEDVIGEGEDVLESADCVNEFLLVVCYTHDVKSILQIRSLGTGILLHPLPLEIGAVSSVSGKKKDSEIFYSFTGFLNPGTIFRCDLNKEEPQAEVFREIRVKGFDPSLFESKQVLVDSKDGTRIPMFIVSKKNTPLDSSHPTLLYGYGGFSISLLPSFSLSRLVLISHFNAVTAVANIRGGNEYGEEWHKGGARERKQNCFDDFQSCAEYLIEKKYTSNDRLCIEGGSNGGLLVAACINQRPDLFGCAIAHVGVMDMLRFQKFTVGHGWTSDYGCSDDPEQFQWLIKYSPLHNIKRPWESEQNAGEKKEGEERKVSQYPPTMVLTGDHDDRVVPLHSLKYIATMQYVLSHSVEGQSPQTNPIIARIETKAGHGAGKPTQKVIEQVADVYSFMAMATKATWVD